MTDDETQDKDKDTLPKPDSAEEAGSQELPVESGDGKEGD